jgi:hypothetical protein
MNKLLHKKEQYTNGAAVRSKQSSLTFAIAKKQ